MMSDYAALIRPTGLLFIVLFIPMAVSSEEYFTYEIKSLNSELMYLWTGGNWEDGTQKGYYRYIITGGGFEHYKTKLYVQWIRNPDPENAPKIVETIEIEELFPVYSFRLPTCLNEPECSIIELNAAHVYEISTHKFYLKLTGIGQYEFSRNEPCRSD